MFNISQIDFLPVTAMQIRQATNTDPTLSKILNYTKNGWPKDVPENLKLFQSRSSELTVQGDVLLWGIRVVVPEKLQGDVLQELHSNHPGVTRMKSVARSYIWWPNIDRHIEDLVKSSVSCQQSKDTRPLAPLHPWIWPSKP